MKEDLLDCDVIFRFERDTVLDIFEQETEDMEDSIEQQFSKGTEIECFVFEQDEHQYSVQFPSGSITFIGLDFVELVEIL